MSRPKSVPLLDGQTVVGRVDLIDDKTSLILHRHTNEHGSKIYASGLFQLYDQDGIHPTDSVAMCHKRGWIPCLLDFRAQAIRAGWKPEKVDAILAEVKAD